MGMVICNQCGIEFKDKSPHLHGLKFCDREHFRQYKKIHGSHNKGKTWKETYKNPETYEKMRNRITSTGPDHHLYGIKRPDVVLRNILDNPMYSEEKKKEILDMIDKKTSHKVILKLMSDIVGHRNYQYQRKAYAKYGRKCQICGEIHGQIDVHHIDGDHRNNKIENLQVLCARCHALLHKNPDALPKSINTKESNN